MKTSRASQEVRKLSPVVAVVVVVVRTRPGAILLAIITTRKSIHGFPLLSYIMVMGLFLATLHVLAEQFRAYFLALLADKDFSRVIETVSKVNKAMPYCVSSRRVRVLYHHSIKLTVNTRTEVLFGLTVVLFRLTGVRFVA